MKSIYQIRFDFWTKILPKLKGKTPIFQNSSPTKDYWLSAGGTGISGARYSMIITKTYAGVQLEFGRGNKDENKKIDETIVEIKRTTNSQQRI